MVTKKNLTFGRYNTLVTCVLKSMKINKDYKRRAYHADGTNHGTFTLHNDSSDDEILKYY